MKTLTTIMDGRSTLFGLGPEIKPDTGYYTKMVECGRRGDSYTALNIIKMSNQGEIAGLSLAYAHGARLRSGSYEGQ